MQNKCQLFLTSLVLIFLSFGSNSQAAQLGTVMAEEAYIYLNPDFDAAVIATAKIGETFQISNQPQGPFYRIRLKDNRLGWISEVDVKPGRVDVKKLIKKQKTESVKPLESVVEEHRTLTAFAIQRYQGLFVQSHDWKEKTLKHVHKDNLLFYGWNWTGPDTIVAGPFYADTRVMMSTTAPDYYKKVTGVSASGWIIRAQTSFVSANPIGENGLFHYGLGASTSFSHFRAGVIESGSTRHYTMDDLSIGIVIPIGISYRIGPISTQLFYQFYQEKIQTNALSLGLNWPF